MILQKENKIEMQHHAPQTNKNTKKKKKNIKVAKRWMLNFGTVFKIQLMLSVV